ncbi:MAG: TolC family protein [Bacteroidia bacterium]|nr:TolC family protein [Bacteroidia bacterium]
MKQLLFMISISMVIITSNTQAQISLTIEECYKLARQNYPLVKQSGLLIKSAEYSVQNASKGYLPQLNINGQATYQSDVTRIPLNLPGLNIPTLSKDQYRIYGEINQTVYDGGLINLLKKTQEVNSVIELQKVEVELYKLKERINQLYFGILLVNEQLVQTELIKTDMEQTLEKTKGAIKNGVALISNGEILQVEILKISQRTIELKATRKAFMDMLTLFINQPVDENKRFEKPSSIVITNTINRPELLLFDHQKKMTDVQSVFLVTRNLPKLALFLQGGYGRPALNALDNTFNFYYVGGVRLNWAISSIYTFNKDKAILEISRSLIDLQKETFLFNTQYTLQQQNAETTKLKQLIESDREIIALRTKIKNTALVQLKNGVINTTDYLRELNAEDQALQTQLFHDIQLLLALYILQTTSGN